MKPMLADEGVLGQIKYPKMASAKLNGVRGLNDEGVLLARSLKPIPNKYVQGLFGKIAYTGFDGELVVGQFNHPRVFSNSTSGVMTIEGIPEVTWYVFDYHTKNDLPFIQRVEYLQSLVEDLDCPEIIAVPHRMIFSDEELLAFEAEVLLLGYEGVVLRDPQGLYKFGRSTALEGGFLRYVPWKFGEAILLEVLEGTHNANPATVNELGRTTRSTHKENIVPTGTAGSARVRDMITGVEFKVSLGTEEECAWLWKYREEVKGNIVKYKYKDSVKDKPRFPQWEGFRDRLDMSI
jgi:DNA ligase-1